jgi:hypothetical protein
MDITCQLLISGSGVRNPDGHPSTYQTDELLSALRKERLAVSRRLIQLKREIRERVSELEALEGRLANIEQSEEYLVGGENR